MFPTVHSLRWSLGLRDSEKNIKVDKTSQPGPDPAKYNRSTSYLSTELQFYISPDQTEISWKLRRLSGCLKVHQGPGQYIGGEERCKCRSLLWCNFLSAKRNAKPRSAQFHQI